MANWTAVRPAAPWTRYYLFSRYIHTIYLGQESWYAAIYVIASDQQKTWQGQRIIDTTANPQQTDTFFSWDGVPVPRTWDDAPYVTVSGGITGIELPYETGTETETSVGANAWTVGVTPPIPAGSRFRVRLWITTSYWRSAPHLFFGISRVRTPGPSWDVLLPPFGYRFTNVTDGALQPDRPSMTVIARQSLPLSERGKLTTIEAVAPTRIDRIHVVVHPGDLPQYVYPNPTLPPPWERPQANATVMVKDVQFQPTDDEEPREVTRAWTARHERAKNSLY